MLTFFQKSLRGRLLVLISLMAGSLCLLAGLLTWRAYKNERAAIFRELVGTAHAMAALADERLETMEALLQGLITAGELEDDNLHDFHARALRITIPNERWVVVATPDGHQVANSRLPFGAELPVNAKPVILELSTKSGDTYISNVTTGGFANTPVLFITTSVTTKTGVIYHVSLVVSPDKFAKDSIFRDMPSDHVVAVVDRNGLIAARSRNAEKHVGRNAAPDIVEASRAQKPTFIHSVTLEGAKVLAAVAPAPRSGWSIAVGAPIQDLHASARRLAMLGLFTSLGILAAATAVAWWIVRAAIHDVTALLRDTRLVAAGTLPGASQTVLAETSSIAASLRTMAAQLHRELDERRIAQLEVAAAKDELARVNADLEQKIRERTASLVEMVQQMEEFTYSISHDLRAPVRAITTFGQVILEDHAATLDPEVRPLLNRMIAGGARMDRMINDLLAFSRVSRQDVHLGPVNLDDIVRECVQDHPVLVQHAGCILIEGRLPAVLGHAPCLHQVITNLLTNAVKFVAPGTTPRVRIFSEQTDNGIRLWIADNGIGIPERLHKKLFKLFERVHPERGFEGTGIGLAIVRRAMERMNGRAGVESDGANGSRFWIELSPAPVAAAAPEPARNG